MINTGISGTKGSDNVAAGPVDAITLAMDAYQAQMDDISPQGGSPGDEIEVVSPYTPQ
jgi:hypothetical protein